MSDIRTRPATKEYRDNFDKVFGAKKKHSIPKGWHVHHVTNIDCPCKECGAYFGKDATSTDIRRRLKG